VGKCDPLYRWLRQQRAKNVPATFSQLESILGFELPPTAKGRRECWANEAGDTRHVQCRAWLEAGYKTQDVNLAQEFVRFVQGQSAAVVSERATKIGGSHRAVTFPPW
jgi:hypothetical protein